eukprot:TRINITY_DN29921_c0_g1_i1.p1 TRINITY_DN29921_c0_g1~~TRINITY_DN29921_c0_g1_i1.p1  ORF type:complete len:224 (-),score=34.39 TRINITY_DN29921_c0_g1_i1:149-820(-)
MGKRFSKPETTTSQKMGKWFSKPKAKTSEVYIPTEPANQDINVDTVLAEKFTKVRVNKNEVVRAEEAMNQIFLDSWTEEMVHDVSTGIDKNRIEEFGNILMECLDVKPSSPEGKKLKANLRKVNISEGQNSINAHAVMEIEFNVDDFKSMYGFICSVEQNDGKVAIAYAFHSLKFKISSNELGEKVPFGFQQIQAIKTCFSRHKALVTLKDEGVIPNINYYED